MADSSKVTQTKPPWRHHTVPKVLLKAFLNDRDRIWTNLVEQERIVQLSLDDASVRGGFNAKEDGSVELEHFFANEIEAPFGRLLAEGQLAMPGAISRPSTKRVVSLFFLSQFLRVAGARAAYRNRATAFVAANIEPHHKQLRKAAKHFGRPYGNAERKEVEAALRTRVVSPDMHIDFTRDMVLKHAPELEKRDWRIFGIPLGRELILSDAPAKPIQVDTDASIRVLEYEGVARPDVTLFMPLSPFLGLLGIGLPQVLSSLARLDPTALNQVTAMGSNQVYARTKEALLGLR